MSATYATTKRSSFTTRVTLNMRKCRRRSSDAALIAPKQTSYDFNVDGINSPHLGEVRHSICGSPLPVLGRTNSAIDTTSGRMLQQIPGENYANHASALMLPNDQLQSSICSSVLTGIFNGKVCGNKITVFREIIFDLGTSYTSHFCFPFFFYR